MRHIISFKAGFEDFGHTISGLINTALLSIVYFLGVGPTSLTAKLVGKSFLKLLVQAESYWSNLDIDKKSMEHYHRQF